MTPMPNLGHLEDTKDPHTVRLVGLLKLCALGNQFSSHYSFVTFPDYPLTKAIDVFSLKQWVRTSVTFKTTAVSSS